VWADTAQGEHRMGTQRHDGTALSPRRGGNHLMNHRSDTTVTDARALNRGIFPIGMQLRQLTILRFIAALAIVVFHYGRHAPSLAWGLPYWRFANTAVSFFFFLSGFILTHVYASRGVSRRLDFYVARAARILPLYVLALLGAAIFHANRGTLDWTAFALDALCIQAWVPGYSQAVNAPGWSLSVEVFFYLAFPFLLTVIARAQSSARLLALLLGSWLANTVIHCVLMDVTETTPGFPPFDDFVVYHPITHLATFVQGICAARLFALRRSWCEAWAMPMLAGSLAGLAGLALLPDLVLRYHHNGLFVPLFVLLVLGLAAARQNSIIVRVLSWRPLELLGEISYGLYILQEPAAWFFFAVVAASGMSIPPDAHFAILCVWLLACAAASHIAVEVPMRSFVQRLYQLVRPAPAIQLSPAQRLARSKADTVRARTGQTSQTSQTSQTNQHRQRLR
jgi:peptidoglycan/LPS O-acetylase OafA/YrhL